MARYCGMACTDARPWCTQAAAIPHRHRRAQVSAATVRISHAERAYSRLCWLTRKINVSRDEAALAAETPPSPSACSALAHSPLHRRLMNSELGEVIPRSSVRAEDVLGEDRGMWVVWM